MAAETPTDALYQASEQPRTGCLTETQASLATTGLYSTSAGTGTGSSSGSTTRIKSGSCVSWEHMPSTTRSRLPAGGRSIAGAVAGGTGFHRKSLFVAIKEGIEFDGKQDLRDHFSDTVTAFFRLGTWIGVGEPDFIFQIVKPPLITLSRSFDCLPSVMKRT